jgi:hypothetical protein
MKEPEESCWFFGGYLPFFKEIENDRGLYVIVF